MFKLIKIQLWCFASANAVSIFENWHFLSHRPPIFHLKSHQNSTWKFRNPGKFLDPANAVSSFENWHFLLHRPPIFMKWKLLEKFVPCKRWFSLWKSPFSDASPPYYLPMFPTNYAHMFPTNYAQTSPNRISPSRNSLCRENRIRGARAARMAGCAE